MNNVEIGQIWVGNVDGTRFEIIDRDRPLFSERPGRTHWIWRTENGQTGSAATALLTHACTLATD